MVEPTIRLIFTGLIALTLSLVLASKMIIVNIGGLNSADLLSDGSAALLIGALFGASEQALPGALTRRAFQFVSGVTGKN